MVGRHWFGDARVYFTLPPAEQAMYLEAYKIEHRMAQGGVEASDEGGIRVPANARHRDGEGADAEAAALRRHQEALARAKGLIPVDTPPIADGVW